MLWLESNRAGGEVNGDCGLLALVPYPVHTNLRTPEDEEGGDGLLTWSQERGSQQVPGFDRVVATQHGIWLSGQLFTTTCHKRSECWLVT